MPLTPQFDLQPGRLLANRYVVESLLGSGVEGEVYRVVEKKTGIPRAAKLFYPEALLPKKRRASSRARAKESPAQFYASRLHALRKCWIVVQYHHSETVRLKGHPVECLISELVEGEVLRDMVRKRPGKRLPYFEAMCILHAIAAGLEQVHNLKHYHGDVHSRNIIVRRQGVHFDVRLLDLHSWPLGAKTNIREDTLQLVRVFYEMIGGQPQYAKMPDVVKQIVRANRADLIRKRFPDASALRKWMDEFSWS